MAGIKVAFGGGQIATPSFPDMPAVKAILDVLDKHKVRLVDTAQRYGDGESERLIGEAGIGARGFTIDTKALCGFGPGSATREGILQGAKESMKRLRVKEVDVFYLHAPDMDIPLEETCAGINNAFREGLFARFGLSNYPADEVQRVYDLCNQKGYVLPTVYQGNYSPIARKTETVIFPTLRKLGICFYAYSPLAGGFLTKTKEQIEEGAGRFDTSHPFGQLYRELFARPAYIEALADWDQIAKEADCPKAELAYRWVTYNSSLAREYGDAIIVGSSSLGQLKQTLVGLDNGPLGQDVVEKIDGIWESIKHEAPLDCFSR